MEQIFFSKGRNWGCNFGSRLITAMAIKEGKKVMICSVDKKSTLREISFIKDFIPELKLKIKHQYIKDTDYIYQDELSECPIRDIKTTRKYIGTLVFLQ